MEELPATPITLFTQPGCLDSARVRACYRASGVPFAERDVTADPDAARDLAATGVFATPLSMRDGRIVFGADRQQLAEVFGFRCRCPDGGVAPRRAAEPAPKAARTPGRGRRGRSRPTRSGRGQGRGTPLAGNAARRGWRRLPIRIGAPIPVRA